MDASNFLNQFSIIFISVFLGYLFGVIKYFREQKQKVYSEILPALINMAYNPNQDMERDFSTALMKLWLYANKKVAKKMETAIALWHHPEKGNVTRAFQEAIIEMRKDIQMWRWQRLKPEDVNHLYTSIRGRNN